MKEINLSKMRERAWDKLKRSSTLEDKAKQQAALERWVDDCKHISSLSDIKAWCKKRGVSLMHYNKNGGAYYVVAKQICINSCMTPEKQMCYALHECGHHLIGNISKDERYGLGYPSQLDPMTKRKFVHRVDVIDEELEAWHRGWQLAERLKLYLIKSKYDDVKSQAIRTYMKWALRVGGYGNV